MHYQPEITYQSAIIGIVAICAMVLLLSAIRRKWEGLLNFVLRIVMGTLGIYFVNLGLSALGIKGGVGINLITILTSGILGFPGVAALYGIFFFKSLA